MTFKESFISEHRTPDKLGGALARAGGLLALLKFVSLILKEYHKNIFEKEFSPKKKQIET
jgi:hypothetical protein